MPESDLYPPLKRFLESQGYQVKAEIQGCDVLAVRGEEAPVIVELKLSLNLSVLLQSVDRLALSPKVYVGVPADCGALKRRRKPLLKLFHMLGLGLLAINPVIRVGSVDVLRDPGDYTPRRSRNRQERLLGEFLQRVGDPNLGGTETRKGIMTAYRQRALSIGCFLKAHGVTKASQIADALEEPKARDILYRNVYGWFERPAQGCYALSTRGEREIAAWQGSPFEDNAEGVSDDLGPVIHSRER